MAKTKKRPIRYTKAVGSPPKYATPEDLLAQVEDYFEFGRKTKNVVVGRKPHQTTVEQEIISITGLSLYLGFSSRQSLLYYGKEKGPIFKEVVDYAKSRVAEHYEGLLQSGVSASGMIFMLANIDGMIPIQQVVDDSGSKPTQKIVFVTHNHGLGDAERKKITQKEMKQLKSI